MSKSEITYIQGYIVIDDYEGCIECAYQMYDTKEDAIDAAKKRLREILKLAGTPKQYKSLASVLEDLHQVCIKRKDGSWTEDAACLQIAEIYK